MFYYQPKCISLPLSINYQLQVIPYRRHGVPCRIGNRSQRTLTQSIKGGGMLHAPTGLRRRRAPLVSRSETDQRGLSPKQIPVADQRRPGNFTCAWVAFHAEGVGEQDSGVGCRGEGEKIWCTVCRTVGIFYGYGKWRKMKISGFGNLFPNFACARGYSAYYSLESTGIKISSSYIV